MIYGRPNHHVMEEDMLSTISHSILRTIDNMFKGACAAPMGCGSVGLSSNPSRICKLFGQLTISYIMHTKTNLPLRVSVGNICFKTCAAVSDRNQRR